MRDIKHIWIFLLILFIGPLSYAVETPQCASSTPTLVVKTAIDGVLEALTKFPCKEDKSPNCEKQEKRIHEIATRFIDFDQVSKLALGRYRRRFKPKELEEFRDLFQQLLENTYMKKLRDYSGEKILFEHERRLNEYKVQVDTKVITSSNVIPVSYRLFKKDGQWKVYDILVEGVSLLKNYRQQFANILRSKRPEYLIRLLRKKLKTLDQ